MKAPVVDGPAPPKRYQVAEKSCGVEDAAFSWVVDERQLQLSFAAQMICRNSEDQLVESRTAPALVLHIVDNSPAGTVGQTGIYLFERSVTLVAVRKRGSARAAAYRVQVLFLSIPNWCRPLS
jgi:hypothetical protein